ncbi:MAG: sensor histidine kinase [Lachnospiraceae bacterium]|nr:sensor histidine kinase [Lachnospiraceae bacterium]MBP5702303.1 sensor histidine kinase [Lachnospiraceae bacterium]
MLFIVVAVMTVAFIVSTFLIIRKEEQDSAVREAEIRLLGLSGRVSSSFESYLELSRLIIMDDDVMRFLRTSSGEVGPDQANDAKYGIQAILNVTTGVDSVYIFRKDGIYTCTKPKVYTLNDTIFSQDRWPVRVLSLEGRPAQYVNGNGALMKINNQPFVSIERAIYDINNQQLSGYMMMMISKSVLDQDLMAYPDDNICILSRTGNYVTGNREIVKYYNISLASYDGAHQIREEGDERIMVSGMGIKGTPLVILSIDHMEGTAIPGDTMRIFIFLMAVIVISLTVIGRYITLNITRPIFKLSRAMESERNAEELVPIEDKLPRNEIGLLVDSYNSMVTRIKHLIEELLSKEQSVQRAEMRVLQEQIKPHFLYNSIGTISALALESGSEDVSSALETLGRFYRNFLSKGDREITLEREVAIVRDYLSLQKLRYGDILEDEYDVDEEAGDCIVPKLILQPLVENSIYHGIRQKGEPGVIKISAHIVDGILHLSVYDTGVGMSYETAQEIMSGKKKITSGVEDSFGLWGTIERVRYYSHIDDVVKIESEDGEFTKIELLIPAVRRREVS